MSYRSSCEIVNLGVTQGFHIASSNVESFSEL